MSPGQAASWLCAAHVTAQTLAVGALGGGLAAWAGLPVAWLLDPAFVAAHHVVHFVCLALVVPLLGRHLLKRSLTETALLSEEAPDAAGHDTADPVRKET